MIEIYRAFRAMIPEDIQVYEGNVDENPIFPYVLLTVLTSPPTTETLDGRPMLELFKVQATYVGQSMEAKLTTCQRVRDAILNRRLAVPGREGVLRPSIAWSTQGLSETEVTFPKQLIPHSVSDFWELGALYPTTNPTQGDPHD